MLGVIEGEGLQATEDDRIYEEDTRLSDESRLGHFKEWRKRTVCYYNTVFPLNSLVCDRLCQIDCE